MHEPNNQRVIKCTFIIGAFFIVAALFSLCVNAAIIDDYVNLSSPAMNYTLLATTTLDVGVMYTLSIRGVDWLTSEELGSSSQWYVCCFYPISLFTI